MKNNKEELLVQFNKAFANFDSQFILDQVTDSFHWIMIGKREVKGKQEFAETLMEMEGYETSELEIVDVITHGKKGCVNGNMKMKNPKGDPISFSFCDVYEFEDSEDLKISRMTSYVVDR